MATVMVSHVGVQGSSPASVQNIVLFASYPGGTVPCSVVLFTSYPGGTVPMLCSVVCFLSWRYCAHAFIGH